MLHIADGNKVSRVYADVGHPPDAPNNSDDADDAADPSVNDAKTVTPQRDNRSAAEEPTLYKSLVEAAHDFPSEASVFGSVVGDHFGSGKAARVGGGGRALATVFDDATPAAAAVAATPFALAAAATTTAAAAAAAPATPGAVLAVTAASVAAVTTAAPPTAPTFPSKPAPHKVAFLLPDTTPVHKVFPAQNGPGQSGQRPPVAGPSARNGPGQTGQRPAVPVPRLPPMQGAATLPLANTAPDVITEAGW